MKGHAVGRGLLRRFSVILGLLLLAACAGTAPRNVGQEYFPAPTGSGALEPVPDVDVLVLTEPLKALLARQVEIYPGKAERMQALSRLFSNPALLPLKYDSSQTRTAAETFAAGAADCVSFSNLAVAMARHVGLDARYQDVFVRSGWERSGDLAVIRRHMNVLVAGAGGRREVYDFFANRSVDGSSTVITDARARAQYFNNRGMEFFRAGDNEAALRHLIRAVRIDPGIAFIWSNIGTVYSVSGQYGAAEIFLRRALAVEQGNPSALVNLAELYRKQGRLAQAAIYDHAVAEYRKKNPYYWYELASRSYAAERYPEALEQLGRALAIKADPAFHELRAGIYQKLGRLELARKSCQLAQTLAGKGGSHASPEVCAESGFDLDAKLTASAGAGAAPAR